MLTDEHLTQFVTDGFVVLPDAVEVDHCRQLQQRVSAIVDEYDPAMASEATRFSTVDQSHATEQYFFDSASTIGYFFEEGSFDDAGALQRPMGEALNKLGHAMHDLDPTFDGFSRQPWMAAAMQQVGMQDPVLLQTMYIFKPPRIGGEVTPHIDRTFLWTDPGSVVGIWVAIDDATVDNGCLWAIPGSHRQPPRTRFRRHINEDGTVRGEMDVLDPNPYSTDGGVPLEAKRGTAVLLHGQLVHWSHPNTSSHSRHAFTLHVIDGATDYPADNWIQRTEALPLRGF